VKTLFNLLLCHPDSKVLRRAEEERMLTAEMIKEQIQARELESFSETHFALQAWIN